MYIGRFLILSMKKGGVKVDSIILIALMLYVAGLFLVVVEAHIPGFGIAGISGLVCLIVGIYIIADGDMIRASIYLVGTLIFLAGGLWVLYNTGYGRKHLRTFFLFENQSKEKGYVSTKILQSIVGKEGYVATPLRPAGAVLIENVKYDAVSDGEFIDKDERIRVTMVEGRKILVKRLDSLT